MALKLSHTNFLKKIYIFVTSKTKNLQMSYRKGLKFPLSSKSELSQNDKFYKEIIKRHKEACSLEQSVYIDPETGFSVFTAYYHLKRGNCCGSSCRHCPYGE